MRCFCVKTFPKPLGAEEEQYYLQKSQLGDPEEKDLLIENNLGLVAHIVKKYQHLDDDPEDLISIGTIGLIKAVSTYDQSKGSRLATYAARCIDNELLMFLRSKKKSSKEISLYEPIGTDKEGNELNLLDVIEHNTLSVTDKVNLKQDIEKLYEVLEKTLTPREKMVIELRYGLYNQKEKTQREIAEMLGISRSYVSRIEKNALAKLRKLLE